MSDTITIAVPGPPGPASLAVGAVITQLGSEVIGGPAGTPIPRLAGENDTIALSRLNILPDTGADLTSAIQTVISANPGKTILFDRPGVYLVNTVTSNSLKWCLSVTTDNTVLELIPGAELKTTQDAALVFFAGPARNGAGFTNWSTQRWAPKLAVYAITGSYAKGAMSVTLATPADVTTMGLASGKFVLFRTGQTVDAPNVDQPDGCIMEVLTADAGTGVVTFTRPIPKPMTQEYYISGTTGKTSTTVTANPAPYGLSAIDPYVLRNVGIRGGKLTAESLTTQNPFVVMHADNLILSDLDIRTSRNGFDVWGLRDYVFRDIRVLHTAAGTWWTSPMGATCQSHGKLLRVWGFAPLGVCYLHCHEGAADVFADDVRQYCGASGATNGPFSARSRGYDLKILNSLFYSKGTVSAVFADDTVIGGLVFDHNTIRNESGGAVRFAAAGQVFGPSNRVELGDVFLQQSSGAAPIGGHAPVSGQVVGGWCDDLVLNYAAGTIPPAHLVWDAIVDVVEAFNGTSPLFTLGTDTDVDRFVTSIDLTVTGPIHVIVGGAKAGVNLGRYTSIARAIEGYVTHGATAPTAGKVVFALRYSLSATQVT